MALGQVNAPNVSHLEPSALDDLFEKFFAVAAQRTGATPNLTEWVDLAEGWRIVRALRDARGNRAAAARALGIGRRTLYTKMEKLGIAPRFSLW
jgi:transcriptional regulator of acetoin/glycerol metabolism